VIPSKNMLFEADKVMFEIYRETEYTGKYRVCYFTELQDHNKESEINHALAGEHFFDGFIKNFKKDEAKEIIASILGRLNNGGRFHTKHFLERCPVAAENCELPSLERRKLGSLHVGRVRSRRLALRCYAGWHHDRYRDH